MSMLPAAPREESVEEVMKPLPFTTRSPSTATVILPALPLCAPLEEVAIPVPSTTPVPSITRFPACRSIVPASPPDREFDAIAPAFVRLASPLTSTTTLPACPPPLESVVIPVKRPGVPTIESDPAETCTEPAFDAEKVSEAISPAAPKVSAPPTVTLTDPAGPALARADSLKMPPGPVEPPDIDRSPSTWTVTLLAEPGENVDVEIDEAPWTSALPWTVTATSPALPEAPPFD